ncbi:hypothetical protein ATCC51562_1239 [Campylobacter concisus ATCC 51562]|uniref:Uncharacterized protein n=1 Tax=Campylobacter concisus ATCC 51562 TaxID=1242969 RepID=U2GI01_9BACT|nr:hypothetical protein ATCC51562_1239 [Campylobacter concisus ATCC 51562]
MYIYRSFCKVSALRLKARTTNSKDSSCSLFQNRVDQILSYI